ncbi:hypothetical protein M5C97_17575 [Acidovorax sp. NCPPB 3859]|nr:MULTISPECIES: hypothetical protein [unclassified Acidovorax]MDA8461030.1 hypothetical protein [Acidovorax sp. GBBC 3333]MDA8466064.1 hypothetical protein [Acidovorax sp. GBBC 3332]MDA8471100.1 hypothetical protein [Acidovorax sp. GBBC 3299]WCM77314.1 hypothetical protein M5C94_17525 [Acidovorax sp. GBBC 712]WCM82205.1 hypothetical protein M5C97_17575 [Acidovorax sp. NCPPB 3859]
MHFNANHVSGAGASHRRSPSPQPAASPSTRPSRHGHRLDAAGGPRPRAYTFQTDAARSGPPPRRPAPALPDAQRTPPQPAAPYTLAFADRFLSNGPVEAVVRTPEQEAQLARADSAVARLKPLVSLRLGTAVHSGPSAADVEQIGTLQHKLRELRQVQAQRAQLAEDVVQLREAWTSGKALGIDWVRHKEWEGVLKARPGERLSQVEEGIANLEHRLREAAHEVQQQKERNLRRILF